MLDLNARVTELQEENKYQLSLRDIEYKEKINELTEKCIQQINSLNSEKEVSVKKSKMKTILILQHNSLFSLTYKTQFINCKTFIFSSSVLLLCVHTGTTRLHIPLAHPCSYHYLLSPSILFCTSYLFCTFYLLCTF